MGNVKNWEILDATAAADLRRQQGQPLGRPPPPISKKKLESTQHNMQPLGVSQPSTLDTGRSTAVTRRTSGSASTANIKETRECATQQRWLGFSSSDRKYVAWKCQSFRTTCTGRRQFGSQNP